MCRHLSSPNRVYIEQLQARRFQAAFHDLRKALQNFVAEIMIFLALRSQALAIQGDGAYCVNRAGVELPLVWSEKPRPPKNFTLAQRGDNDWFVLRSEDFEGYFSGAYQVKSVC